MDAKTCPRSALLVARLTDGRNSMHRGLDLWGIVIVKGSRCRFSSAGRSEEHTSELQSLMRISYAVFCLKKKKKKYKKLNYKLLTNQQKSDNHVTYTNITTNN